MPAMPRRQPDAANAAMTSSGPRQRNPGRSNPVNYQAINTDEAQLHPGQNHFVFLAEPGVSGLSG